MTVRIRAVETAHAAKGGETMERGPGRATVAEPAYPEAGQAATTASAAGHHA